MYFTKLNRSNFIIIYGAPLVVLALLASSRAAPQKNETPLEPSKASNEPPPPPPSPSQQLPVAEKVPPVQSQVQPQTSPLAADAPAKTAQSQAAQLPPKPQAQPQGLPQLPPIEQEPPSSQVPNSGELSSGAAELGPDPQPAIPMATTDSPYKLSTIIPERDSNKALLDYDAPLLADLQFVLPKTGVAGEDLSEYTRNLINTHHNNEQLYAYLLQLTQAYPKITRLYSVGQSAEGVKLWVLEISENPGKHEPLKPEFRYIANMHGNEVVGRELLLHLARLILENYYAPDNDPERPNGQKFIKKLVGSTRIHLMPTMNPDGYLRSGVGCKWEFPSRKGRLNANNIDLNRNFPDAILGTQLDAGTQPETRAIMEWSKREPFVLSANMHGGAVVAVIPWDSSLNRSTLSKPDERKCPDDKTFMELARAYTKSHWTMSDGKMCYDKCTDYHPEVFPNDGVTTGSGWYQFYGSMMDWSYANTNDFQITLELGCNMYPPQEALVQYWEMNKVAMLNFMRQVHKGIKGMVVDASSNAPLAHVNVHVRSIDHNVTTTSAGDYFRLLAPGQYRVMYEHAGYNTEEIFVTLGETMAQIHNIKLKPNSHQGSETSQGGTGSSSGGGGAVNDQSNDEAQAVPDEPLRGPGDGEAHPVAVATLVMSVITVLLLVFLAGAYVIQKRRFARSQSVSVEMQPTGRSNSGTGISLPPPIKSTISSTSVGSSLGAHLQA